MVQSLRVTWFQAGGNYPGLSWFTCLFYYSFNFMNSWQAGIHVCGPDFQQLEYADLKQKKSIFRRYWLLNTLIHHNELEFQPLKYDANEIWFVVDKINWIIESFKDSHCSRRSTFSQFFGTNFYFKMHYIKHRSKDLLITCLWSFKLIKTYFSPSPCFLYSSRNSSPIPSIASPKPVLTL